jgi:hypothetical protein
VEKFAKDFSRNTNLNREEFLLSSSECITATSLVQNTVRVVMDVNTLSGAEFEASAKALERAQKKVSSNDRPRGKREPQVRVVRCALREVQDEECASVPIPEKESEQRSLHLSVDFIREVPNAVRP